MSLEARAQARHADQLDGVEPGQLAGSISHPHLLGLIFERLPGAEPWLTAGRLSKAWRQWAAQLREDARQAHTAEPWDDAGAPLLPPWFVEEQWPWLSAAQRGRAAVLAARRGELELLRRVGAIDVSRAQWRQLPAIGRVPLPSRRHKLPRSASATRCFRPPGPPTPLCRPVGHAQLRRTRSSGTLCSADTLGHNMPAPYLTEHYLTRRTFYAAALAGHLEVLRWLRGQEPPCPWDGAMHAAAQGGHVEVLKWLRQQEPPCPWGASTGAAAAGGGHLEVLQWLRQQEPPCPLDAGACHAAARGGHLDALRWLQQQEPPCPLHEWTWDVAAAGGHLEVLNWLREQEPTSSSWGKCTCSRAAGAGHLEVVKWLRQQRPPCPWNEETCTAAAYAGHLEVLQWMREQKPPCPWGASTCAAAAAGGHLEVLRWLRAQDPPCPWNKLACQAAAEGGHLEVLRWLRAQDPP